MTSSARKVKSADRTLDILEVLAAASHPMSAPQLSAALGIPKSSLFHLTSTLVERRYLAVDAANRYRLGPRLAELALGRDTRVDLSQLVAPALHELSASVNETCGFSIERGDQAQVVSTIISKHALTYTMAEGDLAPLYAISSGKIILAHKSPEWLAAYLARVTFERFTPNTTTETQRLLAEIERARRTGFGTVDEEYTPGIVGVAAVVRIAPDLLGAVNVAVPKPRAGETALSKIQQRLRVAVSRIEAALHPEAAAIAV